MDAHRQNIVQAVRSHLRPIRLRARSARIAGRNVLTVSREACYTTGRRLLPGNSWTITPGTVPVAWFNKLPNFGDQISPYIIRNETRRRPLWVSPDFRGKIVSTGSVISYVREGDIVIGSGMIRPERRRLPPNTHVLALRGPLTAERLGLQIDDIAFGDPGLLAVRHLGLSADLDANGPIGIVPHYTDLNSVLQTTPFHCDRGQNYEIADVTKGLAHTARQISRWRMCVSSSLHGIIVAESMGIPAIWVRIGNDITGGSFKFHDYYLGTGRSAPNPLGLREALELAGSGEIHKFDPDTTSLENAFSLLRDLLDGGLRNPPHPQRDVS